MIIEIWDPQAWVSIICHVMRIINSAAITIWEVRFGILLFQIDQDQQFWWLLLCYLKLVTGSLYWELRFEILFTIYGDQYFTLMALTIWEFGILWFMKTNCLSCNFWLSLHQNWYTFNAVNFRILLWIPILNFTPCTVHTQGQKKIAI